MTTFACVTKGEATLLLSGKDIPAFLQGQLTCDTRGLSPGVAIRGALCNPKGRVITDLVVVQLDDTHCVLRLRRSVAEKTATVLARYAQFSRISVDYDGNHAGPVGWYGETTLVSLDAMPATAGAVRIDDGVCWLRRGPAHGEAFAVDGDRAQDLAHAVQSVTPGREEHWCAADLRTGHYAVEDTDSERFTPQALNYDRSGLVAFDKGCYTGQEVVARLHYKGQSKRRLAILSGGSPLEDAAGTALKDAGDESMGSILRVETDLAGQVLVAAELRADVAPGPLTTESGQRLQHLATNTETV